MAASVVSTSISEIAPTAVVLPTPKPPAITIFTGIGGRRSVVVELVQSTDDPFNDLHTSGRIYQRALDHQVTARHQVTDEHPDDAQVQAQSAGDLNDGVRLV